VPLDNAYEGFGSLDFAPESRLAWNFAQSFSAAVEEYDDFGPIRRFYRHNRQSHQLFSVVDFRSGSTSVEVGFSFGLSTASDHRVAKLILSRDLNRP
jgi:hypothetical protein